MRLLHLLAVIAFTVTAGVHTQYIGNTTTLRSDVSAWTPWSPCSRSCGVVGRKRRTRKCLKGTCEGVQLERRRVCYPGVPCPKPYLPWGEWSPCSATCGQGAQIRYRECSFESCIGEEFESRTCNQICSTTAAPTTPTPVTRRYCQPPVSKRVIGAVDVTDCSTSPSSVSFELIGPNTLVPVCSGVLLSPNHVLTTNSCAGGIIDVPSGFSYSAVAGNASGDRQRQAVGEVSSFQGASGTTVGGDLAIVHIPDGFVEDACATPVCLPLATEVFNSGQSCSITGWTAEELPPNPTTFVLSANHQTADVTLVSTPECKDTYSSLTTISTVYDDTVCIDSVTNGVAICRSDLGWSLTCNDVNSQPTLIGLALMDFDSNCPTDRPSRFQSVQPHLDWIASVLEGGTQP